MGTPKRLRLMVSNAIQATNLSLPELAKLSGIPYHTLRSYRLERRFPSPESLRKLAKALRAHALNLGTVADRLDAEADRNPD